MRTREGIDKFKFYKMIVWLFITLASAGNAWQFTTPTKRVHCHSSQPSWSCWLQYFCQIWVTARYSSIGLEFRLKEANHDTQKRKTADRFNTKLTVICFYRKRQIAHGVMSRVRSKFTEYMPAYHCNYIIPDHKRCYKMAVQNRQ